jgi:hypothetical protein
MLVVTHESHLDHALSTKQIAWVLARFKENTGFSIQTVDLPPEIGTVPCGLYGPAMGDAPVPDAEVRMAPRGDRTVLSRLCKRPGRQTSKITVIMGPDDFGHDCVLYTSYGGPVAPREPGDPGLRTDEDRAEAAQFWSKHALSEV